MPRHAHPLRVYGWLELGIGALGLLILFGMPIVGGAYTAWAGSGVTGILLRGAAAAVCLLPPTLLMGATLPAIARWVKQTPDGVAWLGFFYGGNTAGAVVGTLLGGFYLLSYYDISIATYVAVALNLAVGAAAMAIAVRAPRSITPSAPRSITPSADAEVLSRSQGSAVVYLVAGLSGMTALACEVIWTRSLSLLFGATVYTFSLILAVFLAGLGIGSTVGAFVGRTVGRPRVALGWCQIALAGAMAWTAWVLTQSLPYWPVNPSIAPNAWIQFQLDLVRCLFAVLPGAILWGASFPLALASIASDERDPARLVGGVYAANTLGAIAGSLVGSLLLVVWLGTQRAQQLLILLSALSGLLLFAESKLAGWTFAAGGALAALMALSVQPVPGIFVAFGRYTPTQIGQAAVIYVGEGWNASLEV
jgi:spermidine synthase